MQRKIIVLSKRIEVRYISIGHKRSKTINDIVSMMTHAMMTMSMMMNMMIMNVMIMNVMMMNMTAE